MRILTITLLLTVPFSLLAQDKIAGRYRDYFGSCIQLNPDNTFKYTWHFDLASSWTKGTWSQIGDTVYFQMIPTYDTLKQANSNGISSDTLILSDDEISERISPTQSAVVFLSSGGQNRSDYPDKLIFRKGKLYKFQDERLVTKKQKGFWGGKMWYPWYFKSDE